MYQIGWVPREREGLQINCAAVSIFFIIYVTAVSTNNSD